MSRRVQLPRLRVVPLVVVSERTYDMRGPWRIEVDCETDGMWIAHLEDQEVESRFAIGQGETPELAVERCRDEWSRIMHEDLGPADFVVVV